MSITDITTDTSAFTYALSQNDTNSSTFPLTFNNGTGNYLVGKNAITPALMFAAGVVGNVLALFSMAKAATEQRRTTFYKLMAGLAITDLVGTCATSPIVLNVYMTGDAIPDGSLLCEYFSFMMISAGFATMLVRCTMAIERYICLCHPYAYHCKLPKSYAKYTFAGSWVTAVFIASLPLMGLGSNVVQLPGTWCYYKLMSHDMTDIVFNYLFGTVSLICIALTIVCNFKATGAVMALRKRQRALQGDGNQSSGGYRRGRSLTQKCAEMHMLVTLMGVTVIFTTCFGPLMVLTILAQTSFKSEIPNTVHLTIVYIASFNPILDPWVYILVNRDIRWRTISIFRKILGLKSRPLQYTSSCNPLAVGESPMPTRRRPEPLDQDMSCWQFCFHCLCDPPKQRSSSSFFNSSTVNRSPSMRKLPSSESLMDKGYYINKQPSPSEELMLVRFKNSQTKLNYVTDGELTPSDELTLVRFKNSQTKLNDVNNGGIES